MGGRYQTTQVAFKGCSLIAEAAWILFNEVDELFGLTWSVGVKSCSPCDSLLSLDPFEEPKSKVLFGALGSFTEAPNEANAPEPRPNADEALPDGEETPAERGDIALKGLDRP